MLFRRPKLIKVDVTKTRRNLDGPLPENNRSYALPLWNGAQLEELTAVSFRLKTVFRTLRSSG